MTSCTVRSPLLCIVPIREFILVSTMNCFLSVIHWVKKSVEHLILSLPDLFFLVSFTVVFSTRVLYRYFRISCVTYTYSGNMICCAHLFVFTYEQYCIFDIRYLVGRQFFLWRHNFLLQNFGAFVLIFTSIQSFAQVFSLQILA